MVDAGDFCEHDGPLAVEKSAFILSMMQEMGYDAVALGPRELAIAGDLSHAIEDTRGIVLSNATDAIDRSLSPERHVVKQVGGTRVGVFALVQPEAAGGSAADALPELVAAAERTLRDLRAERAGFTVLLCQLDAVVTDTLLRRITGVDLVVMGDTPVARIRDRIESTVPLVVYPGGKGRSVTIVDVSVDASGTVVDGQARMVLLNAHIPLDPRVHARVSVMNARIREERMRIFRESRGLGDGREVSDDP